MPAAFVDGYDAVLLDLDGVVYTGPDAVAGAPEALAAVRGRSVRVAFVTNNASRTPDQVAATLSRLGVPATADDIVTSAQAAATLLAELQEAALLPAGATVLVVGGEGLDAAVRARGFRPTRTAEGARAVVQGFAPDVDWRLLAEGAYAVAAGLPWIASNVDPTIPTDRGIAPGNGTLVAAIATATGRRPVVAGKPEPPLHAEAVRRTGAARPLVVGDRLDTDIAGAVAAGVDGLLVLTGVSRAADVVRAGPALRPAYLGSDLSTLLEPPSRVPRLDRLARGDVVALGGWKLRAEPDGGVEISGGGPPVDGLRALCALGWSAADDGRPLGGGDVDAALDRLGW